MLDINKCPNCGRDLSPYPPPVRCLCVSIPFNSEVKKSPVITYKELPKEQSVKKIEEWYHTLWRDLHNYVFVHMEEFEKWFLVWQQKVPCGDCRRGLKILLEEFPPLFNSQKDYFEWTVKIHNKVNEKLGKNVISLEEAKGIWQIT